MGQAIGMSVRTTNAESGWSGLRQELLAVWEQLSDKGMLFGLLAAWLALFHFFGNPTMGYINTPSLFRWLWNVYTASSVGGGVVAKLMDADDGYCVLIPFLVLGLFWSRRKALLEVRRYVWWPGLVLLGAAVLLHVFAFLVQQPLVSMVAMLGGVYVLVALVWGRHFAVASFFPMVLLVFCVPLGSLAEPVTVPLRQVSADISVFTVRNILGIDVIQRGVQIMDSRGHYHYEVAAACSGIRSLITLFALTTIYGFLTFRKPWKRLLIIALTIPLTLLGNVTRLVCIIVASEAFGHGAGEFVHDWFGFITFAMAMGAMFAVGYWLREEPLAGASSAGISQPA
jgi:exosortase